MMAVQAKISDFSEGDLVEGFFALRETALQSTASGKPYIRMILSDATGSLSANFWDGDKTLFATLSVGGIVKLQGIVENYRGTLQLKIGRLRSASVGEADVSLFLPVSRFPLNVMSRELDEFIAAVGDSDYNALLHSFFDDSDFRERFEHSAAAKSNHHAWIGGLLEHTLTMARYARVFRESAVVALNYDLLLTGIILHDAGKIRELSLGTVIDYTDEGRLLGHISIGNLMLVERSRTLPHFPKEKLWLLQHMILSHHGKYEYGSPVLPAIPEAFALNHIDNLDAKTVAAERILREDNLAGNWTSRSFMLETALYKPASSFLTEAVAAPAPESAAAQHQSVPAKKRKQGGTEALFP